MTTDNTAITIPIGRFTMDIPLNMKRAAQTASVRYADVVEVIWPQGGNVEQHRKTTWDARVDQINKRGLPGKSQSLIEMRDISSTGHWSKAVLLYRDPDITRVGDWEVLTDYGNQGAWFKFHGRLDAREKMLEWVLEIARAYKPISPHYDPPQKNWFFLEHGAIALPYLEQEETYARFEGHPLDVKLEVKTTAVHKVSDSGLVDRLSASLAMNFAPGVDVDKLRTGKRTAAGLNGEEVIFRGTQNGESELSFTWLYTGQVDSGDAPKISIEMEASDGKVDEKLKLWDALLNSFKPIGR